MRELLRLDQVTRLYGNKQALNAIDLVIPEGKIVGLLGPNGSAKSTLIKLINGLLEPTAGSISIKGNTPEIDTKRVIAYLPEWTYLDNWMKVQDLLDYIIKTIISHYWIYIRMEHCINDQCFNSDMYYFIYKD